MPSLCSSNHGPHYQTHPPCFKLVEISKQTQLSSTQDTDDLFAKLTQVLDELRDLDHNPASDSLTNETFIATVEEKTTSIQSSPEDENYCTSSPLRIPVTTY